ncbi:hypothetical protein I4J48_13220, partial [Pseudonocardia sp. KRD-169]|nr:hypothetical protein [Pseudonocardia abyssalis]
MNRNGTHSRRHSGPSRRLIGAAVAALSLALLPAAPALADVASGVV